MSTARGQIVDAITPILPKGWKVVPYLTDFDALSQVVVMLHITEVAPHPTTPLGAFLLTVEATVIDPQKDPARAWDSLDDEVLETIAALDTIASLDFQNAIPMALAGSNALAWNVTFTVPYIRTEE